MDTYSKKSTKLVVFWSSTATIHSWSILPSFILPQHPFSFLIFLLYVFSLKFQGVFFTWNKTQRGRTERKRKNWEKETQERAKGSHFRACCISNSLLTCWSDRKSAWIQNQQIIMNLSPLSLLSHPSFFLFFFGKSSLFHSTIISSYTWGKEGRKT